jgi:arsenate reductase
MLHIQDLIEDIKNTKVPDERQEILAPVIKYIIQTQKDKGLTQLNFICTHNSRRSQFAQVWAHIAADHFRVKVNCYSGGVEITACNERTIASVERFGLSITNNQLSNTISTNPKYEITFDKKHQPVICFSKLFNDVSSPRDNFATIMTCSDADKNCPVIPGAENRFSIRYEDPKKFDDTNLEEIMYDERSMQIATEMFHLFKLVKNDLEHQQSSPK